MTTRQPVRLYGSDHLYDGGFAYSATVTSGTLLFTAGLAPLDIDGGVVAPGEVRAQTRTCLARLWTVLAERGTDLTALTKLTLYVATADRGDLAAVWEVVAEEFAVPVPPAMLVAVTVLPYDGQLVEVEAIAAISDGEAVGTE